FVVVGGPGWGGVGLGAGGGLGGAGGWAYPLGVWGGGCDRGRRGTRAGVRALEGRAAPTLLARELHTAFGVDDAEGMRRLADGGGLGKVEMAAFAEHVSKAADEGDLAARGILAQAGSELPEQATPILLRP